jgi:sensor histidine kinase YesM
MRVANNLANVSKPENTLLKSETYFSETLALKDGAFYISPAIGTYVPYENAYAGAQNRKGERYRGILRFAMRVQGDQGNDGIVVLAVETLPLIELTAHVSPANTKLQAEIDPRETDFAYVTDPEGWVISHPRHFNITGVDENGQRVDPISEENRSDPNNLFRPGNLTKMGFIDPGLPKLIIANQSGESGTASVAPFGREARVLSYATIPYYGGRYSTPAGFGLVVMSTDGARFSLPSKLISQQISNRIGELSERIQIVGIGVLVAAILLSLLLARSIAFPILDVTESATKIESGKWDEAQLDKLSTKKGGDEISRLSRVFSSMAKEVRSREEKLQQRVQELEIFIDETRRDKEIAAIVDTDFFSDLTEKARKMRAGRQSLKKGKARGGK